MRKLPWALDLASANWVRHPLRTFPKLGNHRPRPETKPREGPDFQPSPSRFDWRACSVLSRKSAALALIRFFLGQFYFCGVEFLLDFGEGFAVLFRGYSFVPFLDGAIPVGGG
jgi:hypothetical protein